ncbi:cellulose synthase-like protein E1 [Silene latifolia]|uniref:cellulose synthase-like protein E1 n=1 Tax=Silene latifolia TaxID=37657 RepID=UPI003D777AD1
MGKNSDDDGYMALFESEQGKGRLKQRVCATSILIAICLVWIYRVRNIPETGVEGRFGWIALFVAEIWFTFYWLLTQLLRSYCVYRYPFKDRLSSRHEDELPKVDIFVCTADPEIEPPLMVINTVLSVMAYDYPPDKLSIFLSDDAGSILTFHALYEASLFSKHWLPYCRNYNVEPRSPAAYFTTHSLNSNHFQSIKNLYEEMSNRIETSTASGRIPQEILDMHKGFSKWNNNESYTSKQHHDTILQILIDGRNKELRDVQGYQLPTLVYLARQKTPTHPHHFKAGAMNALLRVSAEISNAPIILNVDCDMYSNNSASIRDALCLLMDQVQSQDIAFVQFPQSFDNVDQNDMYAARFQVINQVELPGLDGVGGPLYIGTGCFHRREILEGLKYSKEYKIKWKAQNTSTAANGTLEELEERAKTLASSTYELNSQWGKQVGLKYGCPVEDVITGLAIQFRGWKSAYLNPERSSFLGKAGTTLEDTLVQHKRWSEGDLQIMITHCPFWYGRNKISFALQLGYSHYCFWAVNSLPTLCYSIIPSLYLLRGIPLFPHLSSIWFYPFAYIIIVKYTYSLLEFLSCKGTIPQWWNEQRIWLYKRTSSYLFALVDTIFKLLGFSDMKFVITNKVTDDQVFQRYQNGIMEFGVPSPMFTVLTTLALINMFALLIFVTKLVIGDQNRVVVIKSLSLQILLCGVLIIINYPLFEALYIRKDKGKIPRSVGIKATFLGVLACALFLS